MLRWGAAAAFLLAAATAHAGGYDTGERDWDFLFQEDSFAFEAATTYVDPQRKLKNVSTTAFQRPAFLPAVRPNGSDCPRVATHYQSLRIASAGISDVALQAG